MANNSYKFKYWVRDEQIKKISDMRKNGATIAAIAEHIGIERSTIYSWMEKSEALSNAIKNSVEVATDEVEYSLFKTAVGFEKEIEQVTFDKEGNIIKYKVNKYFPPNTTAQIFWLKNMRGLVWKDRTENVPFTEKQEDDELTKSLKELAKDQKNGK